MQRVIGGLTALSLMLVWIPSATAAVGYFTQIQPFVTTHTSNTGGPLILTPNNWAQATPNALRAESFVQENGNGQILAIAQITDLYTLNGPVGTTVPVTLHLDVDYVMSNTGSAYINEMFSQLTVTGGPHQQTSFERGNHASSGGPYTIGDPNVDLSFTTNWTVGQQIEILSKIAAYTTLSAHTDASSTGTINFTLPAGYTMTSTLGWTPIPEPASFLPALLLLAGMRRRRV